MIITVEELVKRAMAAADMHDAAIPPATWEYWATNQNFALAILLARAGWTLNVKTQTITVAGSESGRFELTDTPLAIVAIHQIGTDGRVRLIQHENTVDFLQQLPSSTLVTGDPVEFRAVWDQDDDSVYVNFYPAPTTGSQFLVSYIPHPKKLSLTVSDSTHATQVSYPLGWEERISLGMALCALDREESDSSAIEKQLRRCESAIEQSCADRVFSQHVAIRNVDRDLRGWTRGVVYPPVNEWWFI